MKRITMMCVLGALALGGCQEQELPTEPLGPPSDPSFTIVQRDGFHILPPVGRGHSTAGFLGTPSPRVDVCVWDGDAAECEAVGHLAFFTLHAGTGDAKLQVSDANVYEVEWDTRVVEDPDGIDFEQTYQIVVTLGGKLLGTADIRFFDGGKAKSTIDEFTLKDGRTLPIRFGMTVEAVLGLLVEDVDVPETGDFVVQTFSTTGGVQKAEVPSENAAFQVDGDNVQIPGNGDEFTLVIVEKALDPDGNCEAAYGGPQSGGCYVFETIPAGVTFFDGENPAGLAGVCRDTTLAPGDDPFRLAKFDDGETTFPDPSQLNVVDCGEEGIEIVLQRLPPVLRGLARALLPLPRPLHARDEGETGLVGGFSTIFWAVPLELQANPADPFPEGPFVAGSEITLSFQLLGTHQDPPEPVEGVTVQFSVTGGAAAATSAVSDTAGIVSVDWDLPSEEGNFELTAFVPGTDASVTFQAVVEGFLDFWTGQRGEEFDGLWLEDVHFTSTTTGWAVGKVGATILRSDDGGESWAVSHRFDDEDLALWAIHFPTPERGWAVGGADSDLGVELILHTDDGGRTWTEQSSQASGGLRGVHFVDANTGWAVGVDGRIIHTDDGGVNWSQQTLHLSSSLLDVHFHDKSLGWAVGLFGTIQHTTDGGADWSSTVDRKDTFRAVHFIDAETGWVVGSNGTILHTENGGQTWVEQHRDTDVPLEDVHFVDARMGWVVGARVGERGRGIILHTDDGGETWREQGLHLNFLDGTVLHGVHFLDGEHGWAVGRDGTLVRWLVPPPVL